MLPPKYRLFYATESFAYFTDKPLTGPSRLRMPVYDGDPEAVEDHIKVAYDGDLMPDEHSPFTVDEINQGAASWLSDGNDTCAWAGDSFQDFVRTVEAAGGDVYLTAATMRKSGAL